MAVNLLTSGWNDIEQWLGIGATPVGYTIDPSATRTTPIDAGGLDVTTDSSVDGLRLATQSPLRTSKSMGNVGLLVAVMGGINSAVGSFYSAQAQQSQLKSQALNYQYQSDMAKVNARSAEYGAESVLEASKSTIGQYTLQAGQAKASAKTEMAGRGLVLGEGSTRDVEASMDLVKDINVMTVNSNAVRAAAADRTMAQNYRGEALLDNVSAANARRSADSISPFGNAFGSLLSSASSIGSQWLAGRTLQLTGGGY